ncbi:MAG: rhodanese-like domain-containing protein [Desulfocapsaceae bacterium]|nr:rhodanese-like domain-containing protein [Desulfocapsaceae bacterium]
MRNIQSALVALAAVLLTVGSLWLTHRTLPPVQATWNDVLDEWEKGGYRIVTTEELADRYQKDAGGLILVDTHQEWEYRTGHLKGAVNFPMEPTAWSRWCKAPALGALLGPDKDRSIVFY